LKRNGIYGRDEYRCVYCGLQFPEDELTLDHVQPRVRGGDRSEGNLVTACGGCNTLKGQRRLSEFLRDNPVARENFQRFATHVWPRQLRDLNDELRRLDLEAEKKP
jgi:5-methylcytosine-specific restriction endonuclease McrA